MSDKKVVVITFNDEGHNAKLAGKVAENALTEAVKGLDYLNIKEIFGKKSYIRAEIPSEKLDELKLHMGDGFIISGDAKMTPPDLLPRMDLRQ